MRVASPSAGNDGVFVIARRTCAEAIQTSAGQPFHAGDLAPSGADAGHRVRNGLDRDRHMERIGVDEPVLVP
jgi:hypothetical protein